MIKSFSKILFFAGLCLTASSQAQNLPLNPKVTTGTLSNGLTYYIQHNEKPKNRAELRLVIKAGSILETDQQQGLAHFVEHMAFNGTKNFEKNELINFLERAGVRFGAHLNAYTSFDETVYMLSLPTDTADVFLKGFQVLEDWAHNVSFNPTEIDKERGVILEERRLRLGAQQRIQQQTLPVLLYGSHYPERLPIGKPEILKTFPDKQLTDFYSDWYRPNLMAVIVVGDFDVAQVEKLVKKHFSGIKNPADEKERTVYSIPGHQDSKVAIVTDKEARYTQLQVYYKKTHLQINSEENYVQMLKRTLYNSMLNNRINEVTQLPDAPFLYAQSSISSFLGDKDVYALTAVPKEGKTLEALTTVLKENLRVQRFGFTATELERAKKEMLTNYQNSYAERNKRENVSFVNEYLQLFLDESAAPGIAYEYEFVQKHLPEISLEDLNNLAKKLITEDNRVVILTAPESQKENLPSKDELLTTLNSSEKLEVTAYEDVVATEPLFAEKLEPAKITSEEKMEDIGVTTLTLANGVKVFLKPTDFKNKQVLFSAYSPGGSSLYSNQDYLEASNTTDILGQSGIAGFEEKVLDKMLESKTVSVSPYISTLSEGFSGSANIDDMETLLQLTNLYFTAPRFDEDALKVWQQSNALMIKNKYKTPAGVFGDTIRKVVSNYAERVAPITTEDIQGVDYDRMQAIYNDRFANAGDFAFFFVGSFDVDSIKPLIQQYLGNLPNTNREETWKNLHINPPTGVVKKTVYKGTEPKSQVLIYLNGTTEYDRNTAVQLDALGEVLTLRLRERLREEAGGVYGVGVRTSLSRRPNERYSVIVSFGCAPDNADKLIGLVFEEMAKIKTDGPLQDDLNKVLAIKKNEHETAVKQNGYWMGLLTNSYSYGENPAKMFNTYNEVTSTITAKTLHKVAKEYFDEKNYIQAVLLPEKTEE